MTHQISKCKAKLHAYRQNQVGSKREMKQNSIGSIKIQSEEYPQVFGY